MTENPDTNEYLTTKEVAELLRLKERKVYDLAAENLIPCTRATGKLLFSREAVNRWLARHSTGDTVPLGSVSALIAGSHDPLLEWAVRESQCGIPSMFDGSLDGLKKLEKGKATIIAVHLYDSETHEWNVPLVANNFSGESVVLVRWVRRQRGLVFRPGTKIKQLKDMLKHRVVARQSGAGSQLLLEHLLQEQRIDLARIDFSATARSEMDAVLVVAEERADCALGLQSLAVQHQLSFVPIIEEPLDLLVDRRFFFESQMQCFMSFCRSEVFMSRVEALEGYRVDRLFDVRFNG